MQAHSPLPHLQSRAGNSMSCAWWCLDRLPKQGLVCTVVMGVEQPTCFVPPSPPRGSPPQQTSLSGSGNANRGDQSISVTPSQGASKTVTKPCVSWEGCDVCAWMWQEMLSEQSWTLLKTGVNCVIQFEEQQTNPEGFCSAFLGALSGKSCGKQRGVDAQPLWKLVPQTSHVQYHKWKQ